MRFTLVRHSKPIVVTNFSWRRLVTSNLNPADVITKWNLKDGEYTITDQLYNKSLIQLGGNGGKVQVEIVLGVFYLPN
jgi:hypothetical protein